MLLYSDVWRTCLASNFGSQMAIHNSDKLRAVCRVNSAMAHSKITYYIKLIYCLCVCERASIYLSVYIYMQHRAENNWYGCCARGDKWLANGQQQSRQDIVKCTHKNVCLINIHTNSQPEYNKKKKKQRAIF